MSSNSVSRLQRCHIPSSSRARLRTSHRHDLKFGVNRRHGLLQECKEGCDSSRVMRALAVLFVDKHAAQPLPTPGLSLHILFRCCAAFVLSQTILLGAWVPVPAYAFDVSISGRNESDTLENVPGELSRGSETVQSLKSLLGGPKGKEVESCTRKCVPTCIRGGGGAPGLGPISVRKEVIVFKEGFRTRAYCLSECTQVCSLSYNGPSGPSPPK